MQDEQTVSQSNIFAKQKKHQANLTYIWHWTWEMHHPSTDSLLQAHFSDNSSIANNMQVVEVLFYVFWVVYGIFYKLQLYIQLDFSC